MNILWYDRNESMRRIFVMGCARTSITIEQWYYRILNRLNHKKDFRFI